MASAQSPHVHHQVCSLPIKPARRVGSHEHGTHRVLSQRIAALLDLPYGDEDTGNPAATYWVPDDTLLSVAQAHSLGIHGPGDFFGGVVPQPFVATKTITHSLVDRSARAPRGWSPAFGRAVKSVVLPGYSAFSATDTRHAALDLLKGGPVRLKQAGGIGGSGQLVVADTAALDAALAELDALSVWDEGITIERNLADVVTMSVGQVQIGGLIASYFGRQRLTTNHKNELVYGGSTLQVVRGGYKALATLDLGFETALAVDQARTYQAAAWRCFNGLFASRCNYDVAQGFDAAGGWCSGVLEQSWRIGGASGAEIAALEAFKADPSLMRVNASTVEVYGGPDSIPTDAVVHFSGIDERVGTIIKYSRRDPP